MDPRNRPTISEVIERLQEIAVARNVNLRTPLNIIGESAAESHTEPGVYLKGYISYPSCVKM